jgi:hypothetical protein
MLEATHDDEQIIERVAALDIEASGVRDQDTLFEINTPYSRIEPP